MQIGSSSSFWFLVGSLRRMFFVVDAVRGAWNRMTRCTQDTPDPGRPVRILNGQTPVTVLDGYLCLPDHPWMCVLVLHGIGDRLRYWRGVQALLAGQGVASFVFSYSGYEESPGRTTPEALENDVRRAYRWLTENLPASVPIAVLGYSLGSGLGAEMASQLTPAPAGLVLCQGYASLREAGLQVLPLPEVFGRLLPDIWRTRERITQLTMPLLMLHAEGDRLFPVSMAHDIYTNAREAGVRARLRIVPGLSHSAPLFGAPVVYWSEVVSFLQEVAGR